MQTKREYAASLGLAIAGARGKFSNAAKEAIAKAEAGGMKFADASPTKATGATKAEPKAEPVKTAGDTPYLTPSEYRFPEAEYRAFVTVAGKKKEISLRECCNSCRVSLVNHGCNSPTVHNFAAVTIERR